MAYRSGIINVQFNQDQGLFTSSMEAGLRIYNTEPLVEKARYDVEEMGSIAQCALEYRSSTFAVVSSGPKPKFSSNVARFYDDAKKKFVLRITCNSEIKAIRIRKDKIVLAQLTQLHVFSYMHPTERLFTLETRENPRGLLEITPLVSAEKQIVIFPGHATGSVQIIDLLSNESGVSSAPIWINAHDNDLACIALNQQGTLIATASKQGTLIRVWDSTIKTKLVELRRGTDQANIYCINFSLDSDYLCCSSDKGTVHIFAIKNPALNKKIALANLKLLNYMDSQWALANFTVPPESPCICAFGENNSVYAICLDGTFHKYVFNSEGNCNREVYDVFLDACDDDDEW